MCQNYAPSQPAACSHERAEPPVIKENANFCDFYQPSGDAFDAVTKTSSNLAKADFSALFTDNTVRGQDTDSAATDKLPPRGTEAQTTSRPLNVEQTPNPLDDLFDD
ncbi:MAG: hypothetical protein KUG79_01750 [Pseudomonadales bacterium]|nr:hypothetical protein [Pseudomonadales bacterium]